MYYQMKIQYEDGVKQVVDTEPTRAMLARSLMLDVFYQDPEIVSIRFYDNNKGKALHINR